MELRGKFINLFKVVWDAATSEATWELEDKIRDQYPYLFLSKQVLGENFFCCWVEL
uniref:Chromo domain-containing protein n=1 Tax=Cajanus cajan TaxID=3821 RepID=A0A151RTR8_CAJCA|nr:hypothetical protein KK1_032527 [Cajanus cajan]